MRRRGEIGGDGAPRRGLALVREIVEDVVARFGASGKLVLRLERALLQEAQDLRAFRPAVACDSSGHAPSVRRALLTCA
jgi:hypothetical protein